jgi:hypothetical protein
MENRIVLDGSGGTIALMEWIRANNYPDLDCHHCYNKFGRYTLTVSNYEPDKDDLKIPEEKWFVYEGMRRIWSYCIWILDIDGHWYYVTN